MSHLSICKHPSSCADILIAKLRILKNGLPDIYRTNTCVSSFLDSDECKTIDISSKQSKLKLIIFQEHLFRIYVSHHLFQAFSTSL